MSTFFSFHACLCSSLCQTLCCRFGGSFGFSDSVVQINHRADGTSPGCFGLGMGDDRCASRPSCSCATLGLLGCISQQWFGCTTYTASLQFHTHVVDKAPEVLPLWFEPNSTSAHSLHFVSSWFHTGAEEFVTHCGTMFGSHVLTRQKQTSQLFLTSCCSNTIAAICDGIATYHYGAGQSNNQRHAC